MPFTPPATYESQGSTGYLSTFALLNNASPPVYVPVLEVKSFTVTPITVPNVDFTHLQSPLNTRELRPGMIMPGKAELSGQWIADPTQLALSTDAQAQTIVQFQVKMPAMGGTETCTYTGKAFLADLKLGPFENDKPIEYSSSFQCAGAYTLASS